jgi:oxygen-independent coproporphyrinogen-3 oxidase
VEKLCTSWSLLCANPAVFEFTAPPLSLYIHFPWCVSKCPYCDFNSHALRGELPEQAYVDALLKDLEFELPAVWGRTVQSVFMGGGTPSLFSPIAIERLLSGVRARLPLAPGAEITLEANPGTVEQEHFHGYREAGVNRLSIGIQSFNDRQLRTLGRIHASAQAHAAGRAARAAGFDNFNLDLMFGLPQQTLPQALDDLATAIELQPAHLSWYQLTLEPNTQFYAQPPTLPDDESKWEMQQHGQALLNGHGYTQYEVSAFARKGRACRHNINYWRFGDYLGIGAGAHGKITDAGTGAIRRTWRKRHPRAYLESAARNSFVEGARKLSAGETVFEYALNRLRLRQPFTLGEFETCTGLSRSWILTILRQAETDNFMTLNNETAKHTEKGWLFLDDLVARFLPEVTGNAGNHPN